MSDLRRWRLKRLPVPFHVEVAIALSDLEGAGLRASGMSGLPNGWYLRRYATARPNEAFVVVDEFVYRGPSVDVEVWMEEFASLTCEETGGRLFPERMTAVVERRNMDRRLLKVWSLIRKEDEE